MSRVQGPKKRAEDNAAQSIGPLPTSLAMVSLCSEPDQEMLARSHNVLWVTTLESGKNMCCIPVTSITSVVSLLPFPDIPGKLFLFEDMGPDITYRDSAVFLGGIDDDNVDT